MKRLLLIMVACIPMFGLMAAEVEPMPTDTIIKLENKSIEVSDNGDRMKVKVYEYTEEGDSIENEQVFEGHYRNGQSYERRKHIKSIQIPVPTWEKHKKFDPHWAGFGMGFANFVEDGEGIDVKSGSSLEYNLNVMEFSFPFSRYNWAVVTGAGMRWSRYRLDSNSYLKEVDGSTVLVNAPDGIHYSASKLNITSITIPLLLEWQTPKYRHKPRFFVSGGVEAVVKMISSSKVVYRDSSGEKQKEKMDRGMTLRPLTMDFLFQIGVGCIGAYVKYSPMSLFENNKGPKVQPVALGVHLHI